MPTVQFVAGSIPWISSHIPQSVTTPLDKPVREMRTVLKAPRISSPLIANFRKAIYETKTVPTKVPKQLRRFTMTSDVLEKLRACAKFKDRAHKTHHQIHVPELNTRLQLDFPLPASNKDASAPAPDTPSLNLSNTSPINIISLGNSMLERFKTTGADTNMGRLGNTGVAWNAGGGGDKNESVAYRLTEDLYDMLRDAKKGRCDIKV
jgi:hypothetical protein